MIQTHADIDGFFLDYFVGDSVNLVIVRKSKQMKMNLILKEYAK